VIRRGFCQGKRSAPTLARKRNCWSITHDKAFSTEQTESRIAMIERRALVRHKTFIKGRIYFNNRLSSVDCIVRDMTEKGARLQVPESVALPDAFDLYLPNKDEHFRAQAQWRKGDQIGVSWTPEGALRPKAEGGGQNERSLMDRVARLEHEVAALQRRFETLRQQQD
jgi:hypothetical protein